MDRTSKLHGRAGWRLLLALLALLATSPALADCAACAVTARRFAVDQHFNGVILVGHGSQVDDAEAARQEPLGIDLPLETAPLSRWVVAMLVVGHRPPPPALSRPKK